MIQLLTADYVIVGVAVVAGVLGMFGGFSGALGFCSGAIAAVLTARFGYGYLSGVATSVWAAGLGTAVCAMFAFGIVRAVVRKVVHGLLAQPADAIFGALIASITGAALSLSAIYAARVLVDFEVESSLLKGVLGLVGR